MNSRLLRAAAAALFFATASGCTTTVPDSPLLAANLPTSILILPPLDETAEVDASYSYLSTVTRPLAERGYYVFPVAMVADMMRSNGLPTPYEMHQVPLAKLDEIFGADAVMYLTVTGWGTSYQIVQSVTQVGVQGRLVDIGSGQTLWDGDAIGQQSSGDGGGGLVGMLAGALVNQVATSISDPSYDVARMANSNLFAPSKGLIDGPRHPDRIAAEAAADAAAAEAQAAANAAPTAAAP